MELVYVGKRERRFEVFRALKVLDYGVWNYNTVYSCRWLSVFLRNLLPNFYSRKWRWLIPLKQ
jgi:hypothetical protein